MNGTDWPSPAANLSLVEQQIHKLLAATGIDVPSLATGILSEFLLLSLMNLSMAPCTGALYFLFPIHIGDTLWCFFLSF